LLRALVLANLTAIHQKKYIGKLSAYCGAVSAAVGAGAGMTYLKGGNYEKICHTITNTIATIGGMVCDGAKASCAAKIASAIDAAFTGMALADEGKVFRSGEGLVGDDVEDTIKNFGLVGGVGMKTTDIEIIKLMLKEH
jgi:L-cysteine desulfidase